MSTKTINDNPRVTDTIVFDLDTPDADGCFLTDPYKVDQIIIYYIERDYQKVNYGEYEKVTYVDDLLEAVQEARATVCDDPTAENVSRLTELEDQLTTSATRTTFYFKDRVAIKIIGTPDDPAWLSTDTDEAKITQTSTGHFELEWTPGSHIREGDFFICWTWTPQIAGSSLSAHLPFSLLGDPSVVTTIPTHITPEEKYSTLLERYLPSMYKKHLTDADISPETLDSFNEAVAMGFTFTEDLANQIIDLFDANALHESMLVYLSNLFDLRLRSEDPTMWRRQIKTAIPLFKKKGTLEGLTEALAQAGITLNSCTQYWQVISPYTWQESFLVSDSTVFPLMNSVVEPIDEDNFGLWIRRAGEDDYEALTSDYVEFSEVNGVYYMTWTGENLSANPITLEEGDIIRVLYEYNDVPGVDEQQIEDYIRSLPLADTRDETDQEFPPKNWNVRLINETDALFDVIIPVRHPFHQPVIFGQIRTEFPYSEKMYNSEEYNGSVRDTTDPCFINKDFIDPCGGSLSSLLSIDVSIEQLTNDRVTEAREIIQEYKPFHAVIYDLNFTGQVLELIPPPVETIEMLITWAHTESFICGEANPLFNRVMNNALTTAIVTRSDLAESLTVSSGNSGLAYNSYVNFIAPTVPLQSLGIIVGSNLLEILSPSLNSGTYTLDLIVGNTARVNSAVDEPVSETMFTFNLYNRLYSSSAPNITQSNKYELSDTENNFAALGVKTLWDIENDDDYSGGSWKVQIDAYGSTYEIIDILPNGVLILENDGSLPTSDASDVEFILLDDDDETVAESTTGELNVKYRGFVTLNDPGIVNRDEIFLSGDKFIYDGNSYAISDFVDNDFYIEEYNDGNVISATMEIRRELAKEQIGYFGYRGLELNTGSDHLTALGIINGDPVVDEDLAKDDSNFKENYLVKIDDELYRISYISADHMILVGHDQAWETTGTVVEYDILHISEIPVSLDTMSFDRLDRRGRDIVIMETEENDETELSVLAAKGTNVHDIVEHKESVEMTIEWSNGNVEERTL